MDDTDNVDQTLDPRIQIELENLNDATDDINKLETELDEAHTAFRQLLSETTRRLKEILNKVGNSSVEKARCYYEALEEAHQAQIRCQEQAQLFQRASEIHMAAKETVALAESRFMSHQHEWNFDQAWQDMLNHATLKVMDAENQKAECGREHYRRAIIFHNAEKRLLELEEKHRRAIMKARSYFEVKAQCDQMLATQKERVECLQKAIQNAKTNYASSLHRLEEISNQIHQQRQDYDFIANGPREPGVGAELVSPQKSISYDMELKQLSNSKIKNPTSNHMKTCDRIEKYDNTCELQDDPEYLGKRSVDGSEATLSQWELELEATMENLKNLTHDNSIVERESREEVVSTLHRCDKGTTKLTNCSQELNLNSPQDNNDVCSQDLNQPKNLTNNRRTFKSAFVKMPLITRFNSNMKKSGKHKINLKDSMTKLLNNSPTKTNVLNLCSSIKQKEISQTIAKYVPNKVFNFGFGNARSQSNSDINLSLNLDTTLIEKSQSLEDIIDAKINSSMLDDKDLNLMGNNRMLTMNEHGFKSNSAQSLPDSNFTLAEKQKQIVNLSHDKSLNKTLSRDCAEYSSAQNSARKTIHFEKLPSLPLLKSSISLTDLNKNQIFSTSILDNNRNFLSLDDLYTNSIRASVIV